MPCFDNCIQFLHPCSRGLAETGISDRILSKQHIFIVKTDMHDEHCVHTRSAERPIAFAYFTMSVFESLNWLIKESYLDKWGEWRGTETGLESVTLVTSWLLWDLEKLKVCSLSPEAPHLMAQCGCCFFHSLTKWQQATASLVKLTDTLFTVTTSWAPIVFLMWDCSSSM